MSSENFLKKVDLNRKTGTRESNPNILPDVKLEEIKRDFDNNILRIEEKFKIIEELEQKDLNEAAEDILRSQIVLLMSGLDFYIHEIIKYGIIQIFNNERPKTDKYKHVLVSMECVEKALKNPERIDWLEENIISQNERKTFMAKKKIKEALDIICKKDIFKNVLDKTSEELNITHKELEEKLKELYSRRNKIAHQSDRNPISKTINHIEASYVRQHINMIKSLVSNIHDKINVDI